MLNKFLGATRSALAGVLGISEEHKRFLASEGMCPHCNARLVNTMGMPSVNYCAADGRRLSVWASLTGALRAESVECTKCGQRWKMYAASAPATPSTANDTLEIVETNQSEEFLREDRRVIDNSGSGTEVTRSITFTKEWTRSYRLDFERAEGGGAELTVGAKDVAGFRLTSEEKLRRTYSVSQDTKEVCSEEVSCRVPARTKLTILVQWKKIWQHGFVQKIGGGAAVRVPFRVAVGMTFDQKQIEDDAKA